MRRLVRAIRGWWSRHPMLHPLVAGALVLAAQPARYGDEAHFAELGPGEHVVVHFTSQGCFASTRARIAITGTATGVHFTATERGRGFRSRTRSGDLAYHDAARLDMAMNRFRHPHQEYCTTRQRVEVSRTILGVPVSREVYRSRSCTRNPGAMSFWELLPDPR